MTDWSKVVSDAQAKAATDQAERAAKAAQEREAENARRATFAAAIESIGVPTIEAVARAITSGVHTELRIADHPATGFTFKAWNLALMPSGLTISNVPACEFSIQAVDRSTKMRFSTSYGRSGVASVSREYDQSQLTQAWMDEQLKTFVANVIAP